MTTLANFTPEQRKQCVGMWCNVGPHEPGTDAGSYLFVLRTSGNYRGAECAQLLDPISGVSEYISFRNITLRPDLPRAWEPDGTPPEGEWLTAGTHTRVIPKNRRAFVTMSEPEPQTGEKGESK